MFNSIFRLFRHPSLLILVLSLSACGNKMMVKPSTQTPEVQTSQTEPSTPESTPEAASPEQPAVAPIFTKEQLVSEYEKWKGTPHRLGGISKKGIDCSGFVYNTFKSLFDVKLPRTAAQQMKLGETVSLDEIQTGDLVFFNISKRVRHVGIYLGNSRFMHTSYSQGVTISTIKDPYWIRRFTVAKRLDLSKI